MPYTATPAPRSVSVTPSQYQAWSLWFPTTLSFESIPVASLLALLWQVGAKRNGKAAGTVAPGVHTAAALTCAQGPLTTVEPTLAPESLISLEYCELEVWQCW